MKNVAKYKTRHISKRLFALALIIILMCVSAVVILVSASSITGNIVDTAITLNIADPDGNLGSIVWDYLQENGHYPVVNLTITGLMTEADITYIREELPDLIELNISGITYSDSVYPMNAFSGHLSLEKVCLPADIKLSNGMFMFCKNLDTLVCGSNNFTDGVIDLTGYGLSDYDYNLFDGTNVKKVRLPENIELQYGMFTDCANLDTLVCGSRDFTDGVMDFTGYNAPSYGSRTFQGTAAHIVRLASDIPLADTMFSDCSNLDTLVCGDGDFTNGVIDLSGYTASSYGYYVFGGSYNVPGVKKVRLPANIELSDSMFWGCSNLDSVVCGNNDLIDGIIDLSGYTASSYGSDVFVCSIAQKVHLPANVALSQEMFYNCPNLDTLVCGNGDFTDGVIDLSGYTASSYGNETFMNTGAKKVRLPADVQLSDNMFCGCVSLDTLICGSGDFIDGIIDLSGYTALSYGDYAFAGSGVKKLRLPENIDISNSMFVNCANLDTLVCGNGDFTDGIIDFTNYKGSSYGDRTLEGTGAHTVRLLKNTELSNGMFDSCTNLDTLVCGDGDFTNGVIDLSGYTATSYGYGPFQNSGVKNVRLHGNILLTQSMFYYCTNLDTIYFIDGDTVPVEDINTNPFVGVSVTGTLYYPVGATGYNAAAFGGNTGLIGYTNYSLDKWTFVPYNESGSILTLPSAPTNITAESGDSQVALSWDAPVNDGGSPVTGYEVQINDIGLWIDVSDNTYTFIGLTNGTEYKFAVRAVNAVGAGEEATVTETPTASLTTHNIHTLIFNGSDGKFYIDTNDSGNYDDGDTLYIDQNNKWNWDSITNTLTFNGFEWETSADTAMIIQAYSYDAQSDNYNINDITLSFDGINTIRSTSDGNDISVGLEYLGNTLTIDGVGTLNIYSGNTVQASCAVNVEYNAVINGGTINAYGGNSDDTSFGILCGSMEFNDGTINAVGGGALRTVGIYIFPDSSLNVSGDININDGVISARGGSNPNNTIMSVGIWAEGNIVIAGGVTTASGGPDGFSSGIACGYTDDQNIVSGGNITITDGSINAKGNSGALYSDAGIPVSITAPVYKYWAKTVANYTDNTWITYPNGESFVNSPDYVYLKIETIAANYGISVDVTGTYKFPDATVGYSAQTAKNVTITNIGNDYTGNLTLAFSGTNADSFTISGTSGGGAINLNAGSGFTFPIAPKTGLAAGTYTATFTASGSNNISASFNISFTVKSPPPQQNQNPDTNLNYNTSYFNSSNINPPAASVPTEMQTEQKSGGEMTLNGTNVPVSINAIKNSYGNGSILFKSTNSPVSSLAIPADLLASTYNDTKSLVPPFEFIFASPVGTYTLPANIASLIPDYNKLINGKDVPISFKVTITDKSSTDSIAGAISPVVNFKLELIDGNGAVIAEVTNFNTAINRTINLSAGTKKPAHYGVYTRENANSAWKFTPHQWIDSGTGANAKSSVVISSNTNSEYVVVEYTPKFMDVAKTEWYYDNVALAAAKKLVNGMNDDGTIYSPENQVTRAEFIQMMANALRLPQADANTAAYSDVTSDKWYYDAIIRAKSAGLLTDMAANGTFKPDQPMLREEMAYVLAKVAEYCKITVPDTVVDLKTRFTDSSTIDSKYASYVTTTVKLGLMQGMSAMTFEGQGTVTRAQAATVLVNMCKAFGIIDK